MPENPLAADLEHVLAHCGLDCWDALRGQAVFVTGGSGFFGHWLLESFFAANDRFGLGSRIVALTRDADRFRQNVGVLARRADLELVEGRASDFAFPPGTFAAVIHAAIDYCDPRRLFEEAVAGTGRVLDFARQAGVRRFLFVSSGAVYGRQPSDLAGFPESWPGGPPLGEVASAYAEAKRAGELLCAALRAESGLETVCARAFGFLGPYQPLHLGAAVGNFLGDALAHRPIQIGGDGTPLRSYLYASDLAIWLWRILLFGAPGRAYNVGGDSAISIRDLAHLVAETVQPGQPVTIARRPDPAGPTNRYLPDITRARSELGLAARVGLREAIARTAAWHSARLP